MAPSAPEAPLPPSSPHAASPGPAMARTAAAAARRRAMNMGTILILLRVIVNIVPNRGTVTSMALDVHATATARLRADGQRYTTGRRALVAALASTERPLTIPQLLD